MEYDIEAEYSWAVSKTLTITPYYSHFILDKKSSSILSGFTDYAEINTGLSIKWWEANLSAGYGWGHISDFMVDANTNVTLKLNDLFGKGNSLSIQPSVDFFLNKNQLVLLSNQKKTNGLSELIKLYPTMTASEFLNSTVPAIVLWRQNHPALVTSISNSVNGKTVRKNQKKLSGNTLLRDLFPLPKTSFGLSSIDISLPVTYNIKDFSFNTTLTYFKPIGTTDPSEFFVSFGVTYSFGL